jgi:metallopeptidase MepB
MLMHYTQNGHGLLQEADLQRRFETQKEIGALCTEFNRNLREYNHSISFTDEELDGLPSYDLHRHPKGPDGKRQLSLRNRDDVLAVMRYVHNPSIRKQVQAVDMMKLPQNIPLFKRIIHLRDQNARLIGCKNHAVYKLPYRIPDSTEWVDNILHSLATYLLPFGQREFQLLEEKKRNHLAANTYSQPVDPSKIKVQSWDVEYYRRLIEEEAAVDHGRIAEYFPLRHTVSIMLGLFSSYLQLRFAPIPDKELMGSRWSEDVEVWSVWDERSEVESAFVGYLYLDLLERPKKYKGNQCVNLQPVSPKPAHLFRLSFWFLEIMPSSLMSTNFDSFTLGLFEGRR